MDGQVSLRPVSEDDLSWLASLRDGPAAAGPHEWHGWRDPRRERRQWAESGLPGDDGGTLVVLHGTDRVGSVSWRKVRTGPTAVNWAIGVGLAPEFRGRGYGSAAQRLLVGYLFAHTQVNRIEARGDHQCGGAAGSGEGRVHSRGHPAGHHVPPGTVA
jgi:RimJ/RimL family protein N-acetyltransferase